MYRKGVWHDSQNNNAKIFCLRRRQTRKLTRCIAWLICIVMVLGMLPTFTFAADGDATGSLPNINFTNPADAAKYEIVGQTSAAAVSGEGLALVTTTSGSDYYTAPGEIRHHLHRLSLR